VRQWAFNNAWTVTPAGGRLRHASWRARRGLFALWQRLCLIALDINGTGAVCTLAARATAADVGFRGRNGDAAQAVNISVEENFTRTVLLSEWRAFSLPAQRGGTVLANAHLLASYLSVCMLPTLLHVCCRMFGLAGTLTVRRETLEDGALATNVI